MIVILKIRVDDVNYKNYVDHCQLQKLELMMLITKIRVDDSNSKN